MSLNYFWGLKCANWFVKKKLNWGERNVDFLNGLLVYLILTLAPLSLSLLSFSLLSLSRPLSRSLSLSCLSLFYLSLALSLSRSLYLSPSLALPLYLSPSLASPLSLSLYLCISLSLSLSILLSLFLLCSFSYCFKAFNSSFNKLNNLEKVIATAAATGWSPWTQSLEFRHN